MAEADAIQNGGEWYRRAPMVSTTELKISNFPK
jgi:hypothetical protein